MNVKKLKQAVEILKEDLDGALLSCDIWGNGTGTAIAGYNQNPQATALFEKVTDYMTKALKGAGFPGLDKYYLLEMENNAMVIVLQFQEEGFQWGILVDSSRVNLGLLLSIAVPNARKALLEAVND